MYWAACFKHAVRPRTERSDPHLKSETGVWDLRSAFHRIKSINFAHSNTWLILYTYTMSFFGFGKKKEASKPAAAEAPKAAPTASSSTPTSRAAASSTAASNDDMPALAALFINKPRDFLLAFKADTEEVKAMRTAEAKRIVAEVTGKQQELEAEHDAITQTQIQAAIITLERAGGLAKAELARLQALNEQIAAADAWLHDNRKYVEIPMSDMTRMMGAGGQSKLREYRDRMGTYTMLIVKTKAGVDASEEPAVGSKRPRPSEA